METPGVSLLQEETASFAALVQEILQEHSGNDPFTVEILKDSLNQRISKTVEKLIL